MDENTKQLLLAHADQQVEMSVDAVADSIEIRAILKVTLDRLKDLVVASGVPREKVNAQCEADIQSYEREMLKQYADKIGITPDEIPW